MYDKLIATAYLLSFIGFALLVLLLIRRTRQNVSLTASLYTEHRSLIATQNDRDAKLLDLDRARKNTDILKTQVAGLECLVSAQEKVIELKNENLRRVRQTNENLMASTKNESEAILQLKQENVALIGKNTQLQREIDRQNDDEQDERAGFHKDDDPRWRTRAVNLMRQMDYLTKAERKALKKAYNADAKAGKWKHARTKAHPVKL